MSDSAEKLRIDKWLWHARFFKTRSLAAKVVSAGHCRVNSVHVAKPAFGLTPGDVLTFPKEKGDVLTFPKEKDVRVIRVLALGTRRGPASEAQALYEDLSPPKPKQSEPKAPAFDKGGRPTKRDRRKLDQDRALSLE